MRSGRRLTLETLIAIGRTSEVYRCGDLAVKVLKPGVPSAWADAEAAFTDAVRRLGVSAPEVHEVTEIDGRRTVVFGYVDGPSLWTRMRDPGADVERLVGDLVDVQRSIHSAGVPDGLPSLVDRMRLKLDASGELAPHDRDEAHELLSGRPPGSALLHGDLHPGNILLGRDGPVVIDWFDATVGHPVADIARTSLLLRAGGDVDLRHLPGATRARVADVGTAYREQMGIDGGVFAAGFATWTRLVAAGLLAEGTDANTAGLLAMWNSR